MWFGHLSDFSGPKTSTINKIDTFHKASASFHGDYFAAFLDYTGYWTVFHHLDTWKKWNQFTTMKWVNKHNDLHLQVLLRLSMSYRSGRDQQRRLRESRAPRQDHQCVGGGTSLCTALGSPVHSRCSKNCKCFAKFTICDQFDAVSFNVRES